MKHLLSIFSLLLTSISWSEDVDYTDLIKRDGLWYEKFTNEPFTGNSTGLKQGKVKDGKKKGEWLYYFESGELYVKSNYKDGKKEGEYLKYHENGQLDYKGNYKDGKLEGEHLKYDQNGQLRFKLNYKDDKLDGEWIYYNKNGQLDNKINYKDGKVIEQIEH